MSIHTRSFGTTSKGEQATLFSITNQNGVVLELTDYGAIWVGTKIPTPNGMTDVILGLDSAGDYEPSKGHLGGVIGRNANRIGKGANVADNSAGNDLLGRNIVVDSQLVQHTEQIVAFDLGDGLFNFLLIGEHGNDHILFVNIG